MKVLRAVLIGLVLVVVLGGGAVMVLASRHSSVADGLKPVVSSDQAARSFDAKVSAIQAAVDAAKQSGRPQAVEQSFTEEELTTQANAASGGLLSGNATATGTAIHLSGGNIIATTTLSLQGLSLNVGVVAHPVVVNGQTQIMVTEIQTGALPLPQGIRDRINAAIGQALDPASFGLPIDVTGLTIVDGAVVLKGVARP